MRATTSGGATVSEAAPVRERVYYFDYLRTFQGVGGFYFEPTGEGTERADWLPGDSLQKMIVDLLEQDPQLEARIKAFEMAYRMQASVPELTDLSKEPEHIFKLYGEEAMESRRRTEDGVDGLWEYRSNVVLS